MAPARKVKGMRDPATIGNTPLTPGMRDLSASVGKPTDPSQPMDNRLMERCAVLRASGMSWAKVAIEVERDEGTCKNFACREEFKARVLWIQNERVSDAKAFVNAQLLPSLEKIVEVRDGAAVPAQTALEAATRLAALAGMSTQAKRVELTGADGAPLITPTDELALIRAMKGKA